MIDLACYGKVYVDITLLGLTALPQGGEERFGESVYVSPGGMATTAVAAARLGLRTALAAELADDVFGHLIRDELAAEGVDLPDLVIGQTATTIVMPIAGERAMATVDPRHFPDPMSLVRLAPRAIVAPLSTIETVMPYGRVYAMVGDSTVRRLVANPPMLTQRAHGLILNESEAERLSFGFSGVYAARQLLAHAETVVITCGKDGALAADDRQAVTRPAPVVDVVDTTGAGDVFVAGYIAAELAGYDLSRRLEFAVSVASRSVASATALEGARSATLGLTLS